MIRDQSGENVHCEYMPAGISLNFCIHTKITPVSVLFHSAVICRVAEDNW